MLSYEAFKEEVRKHFPEYMPDGMELEYEIKPYHKINRTMDGISVLDKNSDKSVIPIIYINEMYTEYLDSDLETVLKNGAARVIEALESTKQMAEKVGEWNASVKENIVFQLINTEENREFLSAVPHRSFYDLSIIYQWDMSENMDAIAWSMIDNQKMEELGLSEEELYQLAKENTKRLYKPEILSMREMVKNILDKTDVSPDELDDIGDMLNAEMWVATNNRKCRGACALLYEELFHELAEKENINFYIFPSSIHEVLLVPESNLTGIRAEELSEFVKNVNVTQVALADQLSHQVYFYDRETREITQITNTVSKLRDTHMVEPQESGMSCMYFRGTGR